MSDEFDPELLRQFARTPQPLTDDAFHARVMARLQGPAGWRRWARTVQSVLAAIVFGVGAGIVAPFRIGRMRVLALAAGAVITCVALLSS